MVYQLQTKKTFEKKREKSFLGKIAVPFLPTETQAEPSKKRQLQGHERNERKRTRKSGNTPHILAILNSMEKQKSVLCSFFCKTAVQTEPPTYQRIRASACALCNLGRGSRHRGSERRAGTAHLRPTLAGLPDSESACCFLGGPVFVI